MKRSNRLIMLVGVFLAVLAFVFVVVLLGGGSDPNTSNGGPTAPPAELDTVVAARDIPLGVTVTAAMVTTQKILVTDREVGALGNPSQAIGKVARQTVTRGQQVTAGVFEALQAADNIECPAGFTCMAVQVDQVSGVGTLIKTGDFVNIVASVSPTFPLLDDQTVTLIPAGNYDPTSVKVLIQGLQVVATLLPPPPTTETGVATPAPGSGPGTALTGQQEIVILAVTPQQSEVIKFVQLDGTITLTLRSPKDFVDEQGNPIIPEVADTTGTILFTLIRDFGVIPPVEIPITRPTPAP